jgi:hypothetical protein
LANQSGNHVKQEGGKEQSEKWKGHESSSSSARDRNRFFFLSLPTLPFQLRVCEKLEALNACTLHYLLNRRRRRRRCVWNTTVREEVKGKEEELARQADRQDRQEAAEKTARQTFQIETHTQSQEEVCCAAAAADDEPSLAAAIKQSHVFKWGADVSTLQKTKKGQSRDNAVDAVW